MQARSKEKNIDSTQKHSAQDLGDAREANALLGILYAAEYCQWVWQAAKKVAMVATEGGFPDRFADFGRRLVKKQHQNVTTDSIRGDLSK